MPGAGTPHALRPARAPWLPFLEIRPVSQGVFPAGGGTGCRALGAGGRGGRRAREEWKDAKGRRGGGKSREGGGREVRGGIDVAAAKKPWHGGN
eukprot:756330-Hanusia_phi.AAC.1